MGDADSSYERDWNKFWINGREKKRDESEHSKEKKRGENETHNDRKSAICSIKKNKDESHSFIHQPIMKVEMQLFIIMKG